MPLVHSSTYFSLKTATKCFMGAKKGRHPNVDEAVFHTKIRKKKKKLLFIISSSVLEAGKIAKFFLSRFKNIKAVRSWCDSSKALCHNVIENIFSLLVKS